MSHHALNENNSIALHDQYMTINYGREPIVIEKGLGCQLWDTQGKTYLDLFSGFGAGVLGHCHIDLVNAVRVQSEKLWHVGNLLHTEPQTRLAEAIAKHSFGGRSYFCHSGSDANESAFKLARLYGQSHPGNNGPRHQIIATEKSFHGRGFAAMMATGQSKVREDFAPFLEGFTHVPYNNLEAIERAIDGQTVAIIVEPIQGEGGVNVPDDNYLPSLRALCDQHDLLLICDEVWTGCGRTGKYFAYQHWDFEPDIMTLAKGVGAGLAVGVMVASERVAIEFDYRHRSRVVHATTLGGNCLSMAVAATVFEVLQRDNLVAKAAELGQVIQDRLTQAKLACIREVRGKGLFIGIELDPSQGWFKGANEVVKKCLAQGLMINIAQQNVLRIAPPLTISLEEINQGLTTLLNVLQSN